MAIDHRNHNHPNTARARLVCRGQMQPSPPEPKRRTPKANFEARPDRDQAVWAEEGPIDLPDIRNPRVRAEVRRLAEAQSLRLETRLLAAGLHVTQMRTSIAGEA